MSARMKAAAVVAGYAVAFGIASIALAVRLAHTQGPDAQAASGMYAFGDTALFIAVFVVASLPPTGAALYFLRSNRIFWNALAVVGVAIAASGLAAMAAYLTGDRLNTLAALSPLRILAAPLLALVLFVAGIIAPLRAPRIALLIAAASETAITVYMILVWFKPFA